MSFLFQEGKLLSGRQLYKFNEWKSTTHPTDDVFTYRQHLVVDNKIYSFVKALRDMVALLTFPIKTVPELFRHYHDM